VKQKKPTSPLVLGVIALVASLFVSAAAYFLLVRPKASEVKTLQAQAASLQADVDAKRAKTDAARSAPRIRVADLYRLAKAMPRSVDMPDVLLELNQLARDTGIVFDKIAPQQPVTLQGYEALPISVTFRGNFYDLSDLLYRLRTLVGVRGGRLDATGRLFAIDTFSFSEGKAGFPQIDAQLTIDAFMYGTPSTTAAGATTDTTSTTTSTDTTTTTPTTTTPTTTTPTASAAGAP
jgi:outer membrane murein-binding lipoprotein Lpp